MPFRTEINSFLLKDKSIEPKEEVQEDEVEFEIESPPAFSSVIPEFKAIVPKDDYDSDPGALDDDFEDESGFLEYLFLLFSINDMLGYEIIFQKSRFSLKSLLFSIEQNYNTPNSCSKLASSCFSVLS